MDNGTSFGVWRKTVQVSACGSVCMSTGECIKMFVCGRISELTGKRARKCLWNSICKYEGVCCSE